MFFVRSELELSVGRKEVEKVWANSAKSSGDDQGNNKLQVNENMSIGLVAS